jgi:CBS domain containing-hemolysin-like protein
MNGMLGIQIGLLILLIFLSGFFSGIETALVSLNTVKVKSLVQMQARGAKALERIKSDPHKLIITILIGNNIVNISAASLATVIFTDLFGLGGVGVATGVMTFLILVFGEISPKTIANHHAENVSLRVARTIEIMMIVLTPIIFIFEAISKNVLRLFGSSKAEQVSQEELRTIVNIGKDQGILSEESADMMHNLLKFEGTKVTAIMTPKTEIVMINAQSKVKDVIDFVVKQPYSRYPLYEKNKDTIIGILDIEDVLIAAKDSKPNTKVKNLADPVFFVPESKEIDDLLTDLEGREVPMAVIVDEYGSVTGIVTIEDILEEIVGEIFDKSKKAEDYIKKIDSNTALVDGRIPIDEINEIMRLGMRESIHYNTVGGFIEYKLQRIPKTGETISTKRVTFTVKKASPQGGMLLHVKKK